MAVGIADNDAYTGSYYTLDGVKYYYIETTGTGWSIGSVPSEYAGQDTVLCAVN
jgi:hypothetical protein